MDGHSAAVLVLRGEAHFAGGQQAAAGDLVVFSKNGDSFQWESPDSSRLLLLAGEPFDEPIVGHGPFVMNTRQEIAEAFAEYQSGAFGGPPS